MPFTRYVEIGRVAMINYGKENGKLVVISDVVDQNRALVDRPDEVRRVVSFKRLALTDFKVEIPRLARKSVLKSALEESDAFNKFHASSWGKKLESRRAKAATTDFDRYKASVKKTQRGRAIQAAIKKLGK
ncbi:hypothetical protein WJX73_010839 [Symbiochloris irregularis]|uniref:Large ribosomal subunit protein eL14 domain-containing protein n=1 Tax=Symbiochloris irregularis TaxID=706552 RepID=A0AAW1NZM6_9CHLO